LEVADMIAFGQKAIGCLVDERARQAMQPWLSLLDECLSAAGALGWDPRPALDSAAHSTAFGNAVRL